MVIGCVFLVLSVFLWWWSIPLNNVLSTIWSFYDIQSITLTSYAIFACMVGIVAGILVRKTVPAMAITLIIFIALRMAIALFWRPYFLPPIVNILPISSTARLPAHAWNLKGDTIDRQGNVLPSNAPEICATADSFFTCMDEHGYKLRAVYQPKERFWLFQVFEGGIYLLLSAGLFVFSYWWVKHKII